MGQQFMHQAILEQAERILNAHNMSKEKQSILLETIAYIDTHFSPSELSDLEMKDKELYVKQYLSILERNIKFISSLDFRGSKSPIMMHQLLTILGEGRYYFQIPSFYPGAKIVRQALCEGYGMMQSIHLMGSYPFLTLDTYKIGDPISEYLSYFFLCIGGSEIVETYAHLNDLEDKSGKSYHFIDEVIGMQPEAIRHRMESLYGHILNILIGQKKISISEIQTDLLSYRQNCRLFQEDMEKIKNVDPFMESTLKRIRRKGSKSKEGKRMYRARLKQYQRQLQEIRDMAYMQQVEEICIKSHVSSTESFQFLSSLVSDILREKRYLCKSQEQRKKIDHRYLTFMCYFHPKSHMNESQIRK